MKKTKIDINKIYNITEKFKSVSYIGRIAYSISCFENILLFLNQKNDSWKIILRKLWCIEIDIDEYYYMVVIIKNIENFKYDYDFFKEECFPSNAFFNNQQFNDIKKLYMEAINEFEINLIFDFFDMITRLVSIDIYSNINGYGNESIMLLKEILIFMNKNKVQLPDINQFLKFKIKENNGWGKKIDLVSLSKIINENI